ncbi:MAG: hypothetical protein II864_08295 [Prevotella sp.]|nr:hypothetical protein [Prevotella sp.]
MKTKTMTRTLMAFAMLFAVQTSANAQLGGLLKKAKNAAEKTVKNPLGGTDNTTVVTTTTTTTTSTSGSEAKATQPADPMAEYVQDIVNKNYLLDDLTDKNRNAKAVADYKSKVNAKVKADLAPTKILGTFSTSVAWQGLPLFKMPELKDKYSSVQEMQFKTFYEKDGKYYVVKSAFRQSIPKENPKDLGAQPQKDYWPGLETPVEIPADKIQGKF